MHRRGVRPFFKIRFWCACCALMPAITISSFTQAVVANPIERPIRVKVLVDSTIATCSDWQKKMERMFSRVNWIFHDRVPIVFRIDTMAIWQASGSGSYRDMLLGDCLVREQPKGRADIVVYMGMNGNPPSMIAMMTLYELGYVYIQPHVDIARKKIDEESYLPLLHGLAHVFGAVHCYYNGRITTIMNPFIHDGILLNPAPTHRGLPPRFHQGNEVIMSALAARPPNETGWDTVLWKSIKLTYDKLRSTYNPWRIDTRHLLIGYEKDAFHEGNLLLYLGSWASLSGRYQEAMAYYDTLETLWKAIKNSCLASPDIGKNRLCSVCGYDRSSVEEWYKLQLFFLGIRRVMVDLRAGKIQQADSLFTFLLKNIPEQISVLTEKYRNGYLFHARRYGLKTGIKDTAEESVKSN